MVICDDIWKEIKQFMFQRHLWDTPEHRNFNKVLRELPLINMSNYTPHVAQKRVDKYWFIKEVDLLWWNGFWIEVDAYLCSRNKDDLVLLMLNLQQRLPISQLWL